MKRILLILSLLAVFGCVKEQPITMKKDYQYKFVCWSEFAGIYYHINSEPVDFILFYGVDSVMFTTQPGDTIKVKVYTDYPTLGVLYENQDQVMQSAWGKDVYHAITYIAK